MRRDLQRYLVWSGLRTFFLGLTLGSLPVAYFLGSFWLLVPLVASAMSVVVTLAGIRDGRRYKALVDSLELVKVRQVIVAQR